MSEATLAEYADVVGAYRIELLRRLAARLEGLRLVVVNSTRVGGGVAELLARHVPLFNELGLRARWEVLEGTPEYFATTKRTTDYQSWDLTNKSTGPLYAVSNPGYYDLRGAKRYLKVVSRVGKNSVTTETSGEERSRVGAVITFLGADMIPVRPDSTSVLQLDVDLKADVLLRRVPARMRTAQEEAAPSACLSASFAAGTRRGAVTEGGRITWLQDRTPH